MAGLIRVPAHAADFQFQYDAGFSWLYSQDFQRTGNNADDDYFTSARFSAGLVARTPRSQTSLRYMPEYMRYDRPDIQDQVDHRLGTSWLLRTGPLSEIEVRQGLSES